MQSWKCSSLPWRLKISSVTSTWSSALMAGTPASSVRTAPASPASTTPLPGSCSARTARGAPSPRRSSPSSKRASTWVRWRTPGRSPRWRRCSLWTAWSGNSSAPTMSSGARNAAVPKRPAMATAATTLWTTCPARRTNSPAG